MEKIRKICVIIVAVIMTVALVACGSESDNSTSAVREADTEKVLTETAANETEPSAEAESEESMLPAEDVATGEEIETTSAADEEQSTTANEVSTEYSSNNAKSVSKTNVSSTNTSTVKKTSSKMTETSTASTDKTTSAADRSSSAVKETTTAVAETTDNKEISKTEETTVHTHSYISRVTRAATCGTAGIRTYTCSCGRSYTETIAATGSHDWEAVTRTEKVLVQEAVYGSIWVCYCGESFKSRAEFDAHSSYYRQQSSLTGSAYYGVHSGFNKDYNVEISPAVYETQTVTDHYECSVCGAVKQ